MQRTQESSLGLFVYFVKQANYINAIVRNRGHEVQNNESQN